MTGSQKRSFTSATQPDSRFFGGIGCVVLALFLFSCGSIPPAQRETPIDEESALSPRYSMVFIIHGDGDYRYHDTLGRAHRADEEALVRSMIVAVENPQAEVFIFLEKSRRHAFLFYALHDGEFYYYRHGRLLAKESYRRDLRRSRFDSEAELYHRYRTQKRPHSTSFFLYFGHEIPEFGGAGYDASYPRRTFTMHDLADGLKRFTSDSSRFDLIVLSTCFNGTPRTVDVLAKYAKTIVASPDNLHLSYFDLYPFEHLEAGLRDGDTAAFAERFAHQAFDRLTEDVQTAVTVAVYDVDRVRGYVNLVDSVYDHALTALMEQKPECIEHFDCAEDSAYVLPGMHEGVHVFYRPPRFGRSKHTLIHSGWECCRLMK